MFTRQMRIPWQYTADDTGDGGDEGGGTGTPPASSGITQERVDEIVRSRVAETKRSTSESLAKELGVDIETAKSIIADHNKRVEGEKSEAQKARDAADAEKAAAETEKSTAAKDRHDAKVERALVRLAPEFKDTKEKSADAQLDQWISRVTRLVDVEVGADVAAIATAVQALKGEMPQLFADADAGKGKGAPPSDPAGTPPKGKGAEDAYARGQERAKQLGQASTYAVLENQ